MPVRLKISSYLYSKIPSTPRPRALSLEAMSYLVDAAAAPSTSPAGSRLPSTRLKHPIVLVHGLGARSAYGPVQYFFGLPKILEDAGNRYAVARLTPWHTIEWRANQLKKQIEAHFPGEKVNLVAHSMGGLDSRYLVSQLGFADRVASVTTIGTPNRGSTLADLSTGLLSEGPVANVAWTSANRLLGLIKCSTEGLKQVTTRYSSETLSGQLVDAPGVGYFSAASAIPASFMKASLPGFWIPNQLLRRFEGDNDGFVSVHSAMWGNHICTYQGDHYGQIGQLLGRSRGLDYLAFYGEILRRLNREAM
jgi:triacylglycerol lipase